MPESCEGDEYVLTITFLDEGSETGEASLDIVLERLNEEGTTDELRLEGDLDDARSLVSTLESEGNCVVVEIAPPEEGEGEEEAPGEDYEVPDASEEVPEPAESLAPVSP
ncbi:MAG TPA: hypothetical protein VFS48_06105 [Solirubrobacterales bacterium]|nr:hypothetical protein [Solirubrobacterales bacterium]